MRAARLALALSVALAGGTACSTEPHHRVELPQPGSGEYQHIVDLVQQATGTLRIDVTPHRLKPASPAATILIKLGYLTKSKAGALSPTALAKRVTSNGSFDDIFDTGDLPIGTQRVVRLTYAAEDDPFWSPVNSVYDEYGYVAHVMSLNPLGRALAAAHVLLIGYRANVDIAYPAWDGRSDLDRGIAFNQDIPAIKEERGETLGLATSFTVQPKGLVPYDPSKYATPK